jgi:hypothetical protein
MISISKHSSQDNKKSPRTAVIKNLYKQRGIPAIETTWRGSKNNL